VLVAELWNVLSMWFMIPVANPMAWTMLLLWLERWDDSMVGTMRLSVLVSIIHLYLPYMTYYRPLDVVARKL
jgi:hypothetical protein